MGKLITKLVAITIGLWVLLQVVGCDNPVAPEECYEVKVSGHWECVDANS